MLPMADEDDAKRLAVPRALGSSLWVASLAGLAEVDPALAVGVAAWQHLATNYTSEAKRRRATQDLAVEALGADDPKKASEYRSLADEMSRQSYVLAWVEEEVARAHERIDGQAPPATVVAVEAQGLFEKMQEMLRERSEVEMRPYLLNAIANMVRRPERFNPTWVRRLLSMMARVGAEHLAWLLEVNSSVLGEDAENGGRTLTLLRAEYRKIQEGADRALLHSELQHFELLKLDEVPKHANSPATVDLLLSSLAVRLIEFVSPPPADPGNTES